MIGDVSGIMQIPTGERRWPLSVFDELKGKADQLVEKATDIAANNADKIRGAVGSVGDFVDEKTGGKFTDQVNKVQDAATNLVDKTEASKTNAADTPEAPKPTAEGTKGDFQQGSSSTF